MKSFLNRHFSYVLSVSFLLILLIVCSVPFCAWAERYHGEEEIHSGYSQICTVNHLREDCWVRDGSFMYYTEEGFTSYVGVDVSKWNGDIDFVLLKEQGVEFVIIRMGYRGYETGELAMDERFYEYMDAAVEAGLKAGVYFYSQAIDVDEAAEEAAFVADHIAGYPVEMPVYFDTEDVRIGDARTDVMAQANYTQNAKAFCQAIEGYGYHAGVYASQEWIRKNLDLGQLADYEIWFANYNITPGREHGFDMWQYSDSGSLEGCDTNLDMNIRVEKLP